MFFYYLGLIGQVKCGFLGSREEKLSHVSVKTRPKKTAEEIFIQNIEEKVKQVQKDAFSKLDKIAEEKIHDIV